MIIDKLMDDDLDIDFFFGMYKSGFLKSWGIQIVVTIGFNIDLMTWMISSYPIRTDTSNFVHGGGYPAW